MRVVNVYPEFVVVARIRKVPTECDSQPIQHDGDQTDSWRIIHDHADTVTPAGKHYSTVRVPNVYPPPNSRTTDNETNVHLPQAVESLEDKLLRAMVGDGGQGRSQLEESVEKGLAGSNFLGKLLPQSR